MTGHNARTNLRTYNASEVAAHYAGLDYLTACERMLFASYVRPASAILDLGVGGGRTTSYLAKGAARYIGLDYAPAMVKACQAKFPGLEFLVADAADLSAFSDASFDVVVFSFNGIDYVLPDQSRRSCLAHIRRVLKENGVLIFSSHNARAVLVARRWNRDRLRRIAHRFSANSRVLCPLLLWVLMAGRATIALGQSAAATFARALKRVPTSMFWRKEGTLVDSAHGGLLTHYSVPAIVIRELVAFGFRLERVVGADYPYPSHPFATDWYYYVFGKPFEK